MIFSNDFFPHIHSNLLLSQYFQLQKSMYIISKKLSLLWKYYECSYSISEILIYFFKPETVNRKRALKFSKLINITLKKQILARTYDTYRPSNYSVFILQLTRINNYCLILFTVSTNTYTHYVTYNLKVSHCPNVWNIKRMFHVEFTWQNEIW
jgi:hypothetical protein